MQVAQQMSSRVKVSQGCKKKVYITTAFTYFF